MASPGYMSVDELCTRLRGGAPLAVIDVRDDDRAGGHIKSSTHVPAGQFKREVGQYVTRLKDKDFVVFHCMMSQVRGPSCARSFLAEGEAAVKEGLIGKLPAVFILEGGFQAFARMHPTNKDLLENFEPRLYGIGWEQD